MKAPDILQALETLIHTFEALGIDYYIGGSIASSAYGIARATLDVDLVANLKANHVHDLVEHLANVYYLDEERICDAVARQSSFNLIHLETMLKVDVFVLKSRLYDQTAFSRARLEKLGEGESTRLHRLASPEDVVLSKLDWYRQGGCISERQWNDILGVLKVQQSSLDFEYMQHWAGSLGLWDLLNQAMKDAGIR